MVFGYMFFSVIWSILAWAQRGPQGMFLPKLGYSAIQLMVPPQDQLKIEPKTNQIEPLSEVTTHIPNTAESKTELTLQCTNTFGWSQSAFCISQTLLRVRLS